MLISQNAQCESQRRHGSRPKSFDELRRQLANPSKLSDGNRQCLLELANRLARVWALGDEYTRVEFSHHVADVVCRHATTA